MTTCIDNNTVLENYFSRFRHGIIGHQQMFDSPFGKKRIVYADWTASGRCYQPIEDCLQNQVMPFMANTHTAATTTGALMSNAYGQAKEIIKQHVNANADDALIFCGSGMTSAVNKLQRILGIRIPERITGFIKTGSEYPVLDDRLKPIVFVTEMEHHSNQVSWLETIADLEIIPCGANRNFDLDAFEDLLKKFNYRQNKIVSVTACSNVTGIQTPYHEIAKTIHRHGGLCFVDFACSAPYVNIDMHPHDPGAGLDGIYFSPHKFLGGPGTPGVLIANKKIFRNKIPDQPGGGAIMYSNPWKMHDYVEDIEQREDAGTPPILQGIKAAMCVRLKNEMGVENIHQREQQILERVFAGFSVIKNVEILEGNITNRLGVVSFIIERAHHNLIVKLLNDRFGIQARGGCSCAGTYGHRLLQVDKPLSYKIREQIRTGNLVNKPGWVRLSIHPTMTNAEIDFILDAIEQTAKWFCEWRKDYSYEPEINEYSFNGFKDARQQKIEQWFNVADWVSLQA